MCRCSFWATDTIRPARSKTRHLDEAVPWSIAATYRSLIATSSSPRNRAEFTGNGVGRFPHESEQFAARLAGDEQSLRRTEDTHRSDRETGAVGDRSSERHLPERQLADLARPAAFPGPLQLTLQPLAVADGRVGERCQA